MTIPFTTVSKIEQIESELAILSQAELLQIRDWLDDMIEDDLEFTPVFEAAIQECGREMAQGASPALPKALTLLWERRYKFITPGSKRSSTNYPLRLRTASLPRSTTCDYASALFLTTA